MAFSAFTIISTLKEFQSLSWIILSSSTIYTNKIHTYKLFSLFHEAIKATTLFDKTSFYQFNRKSCLFLIKSSKSSCWVHLSARLLSVIYYLFQSIHCNKFCSSDISSHLEYDQIWVNNQTLLQFLFWNKATSADSYGRGQ